MKRIWSVFKKTDELDYEANFDGVWSSNIFPNVDGKMYVYIPFTIDNPPTKDTEFEMQSLLEYSDNSYYKPGFKEKYNIKCKITFGENVIHADTEVTSKNQSIKFNIKDITNIKILDGTYSSIFPYDNGAFSIKYIE